MVKNCFQMFANWEMKSCHRAVKDWLISHRHWPAAPRWVAADALKTWRYQHAVPVPCWQKGASTRPCHKASHTSETCPTQPQAGQSHSAKRLFIVEHFENPFRWDIPILWWFDGTHIWFMKHRICLWYVITCRSTTSCWLSYLSSTSLAPLMSCLLKYAWPFPMCSSSIFNSHVLVAGCLTMASASLHTNNQWNMSGSALVCKLWGHICLCVHVHISSKVVSDGKSSHWVLESCASCVLVQSWLWSRQYGSWVLIPPLSIFSAQENPRLCVQGFLKVWGYWFEINPRWMFHMQTWRGWPFLWPLRSWSVYCSGVLCRNVQMFCFTPLHPYSQQAWANAANCVFSMHFYKGPATKGRKHSETGCWWRLMKSWLAMCEKEHQNNEINIWKDIVFQLYNQTCVNNQTCLKRMPFPKKCDQPAPATKHCSKGQAAEALGLKDNWLKHSNMHTALKYGKIADIIQVT